MLQSFLPRRSTRWKTLPPLTSHCFHIPNFISGFFSSSLSLFSLVSLSYCTEELTVLTDREHIYHVEAPSETCWKYISSSTNDISWPGPRQRCFCLLLDDLSHDDWSIIRGVQGDLYWGREDHQIGYHSRHWWVLVFRILCFNGIIEEFGLSRCSYSVCPWWWVIWT